jgi:hypothetical protein
VSLCIISGDSSVSLEQTPLCLAGACSSPVLYRELGLSKVLRWVKMGLLDAKEVITMKVCGESPVVAQEECQQH